MSRNGLGPIWHYSRFISLCSNTASHSSNTQTSLSHKEGLSYLQPKSASVRTIRLGLAFVNLSTTLSRSSLLVMSLWQKSSSKAFILSCTMALRLADLTKPKAEFALLTVAEVTGSGRCFISLHRLG